MEYGDRADDDASVSQKGEKEIKIETRERSNGLERARERAAIFAHTHTHHISCNENK